MTAGQQNLNIQALRALAAMLVVVGHCVHETQALGAATGRPAVDLSRFYWGFGVDIFFVISGFIMVATSAELFGRPGAPRLFLTRRLTRIVPLYWLLTTLLLLGSLVAPRLLNVPIEDWRHIVASYLFIPSLRAPGEIRPVMALGWTLNMEMLFYVLFAGALILPFRLGLAVLAFVIVALAAIGFVLRPEQIQLAFWTQSIILEFLFGCLLGAAFLKGVRLKPAAAAALALLGMAGMVRLPGFDEAPEALRWGVPALLIVAAAALAPNARIRPMLWLAALGDASYSLYLTHPFVLRPLRDLWARLAGDALPLAFYIVLATALATLLSVGVHRLVERPMLRWTQGRAGGPAPSPQPLSLRTTT